MLQQRCFTSKSMQFPVGSPVLCSNLFQSYIKMTGKIKTRGFILILSTSLDTNWCYFLDPFPLRDSCRSSVSLISRGSLALATSPSVIAFKKVIQKWHGRKPLLKHDLQTTNKQTRKKSPSL